MTRMTRLLETLYRFLASDRFFKVIVGFLVISASWIALTGRYPMAFDEDFHLGIIRLYASHGLPFWSGQPAHADNFGAVARDPSYLYHYLMSFPYRLISLFSQNQMIQVLFLRAINVALFASSLPLLRRLLRRAGGSAALSNACLAVLVLIPITCQLAAQINYDNLILPLTALILLLALSIGHRPPTERPKIVLQIIALGLAGSLVKFAFVPIFLAIVVWLMAQSRPVWRRRQLWQRRSWKFAKTRRGVLLLAAIGLLLGLSFERYGLNLIHYQDPIPNCGVVLTIDHCHFYGPYIRDYNFASNKTNHHTTPFAFSKEWIYGMWLRSFFAVDGPASLYETRGPFVVPADTALVLVGFGVLGLLLSGRELWRRQRPSSSLLALVSSVYIAALWLQEYKAFRYTGFPVAINGRYLLPVLTLIVFVAASAVALRLKTSRGLKTGLLALSIGALLLGGGPLTYILRSSDYWYWPNNLTRTANHAAKHVFGPITPGFNTPTQFLR